MNKFGLTKIDSNHNILWDDNGTVISDEDMEQEFPRITSDGSEGAIITWMDWRNENDYDIYARRIKSNGVKL